MSTSTTKLTYYNGTRWQMVLLPDGTRAVTPSRSGTDPRIASKTRYYRRPAQTRRWFRK
jgi:hypothetical protein